MQTTETKPYCPPAAWKDDPPRERARHLYTVFEGWAAHVHCEKECIPTEEQRLGRLLALQDKEDRALRRAAFGDPAYGSHPSYANKTKARCVVCRKQREPSALAPDEEMCSCELSQYGDVTP